MIGIRSRAPLDRVGAVLSLACAVHCLATPVLVASVSFGALGWLAGEETEVTLLAAAMALAAIVLGQGWHAHRRLESLGLFAVALTLIGAGRFLAPETAETPLVVAGSFSIALAHLVNARLCRLCAGCNIAAGGNRRAGWPRAPWKPKPVPRLSPGSRDEGTQDAILGDRSVRFIKSTIDAHTDRALDTRSGGEVVGTVEDRS